ncbi:uncharacterized protein LOC126424977 isoform X2 [Schistocerca serialis cubense]|uniref:uncharacterized protein LOC126424977 isoform X2 n=1 Tax=Schistocerca serialis cubense TaxID=2023355 RepID=UPI00214E31C3|nr:uncharacterized protein LOC126424977 isoform X2 [Schistocerca serialis cubense]
MEKAPKQHPSSAYNGTTIRQEPEKAPKQPPSSACDGTKIRKEPENPPKQCAKSSCYGTTNGPKPKVPKEHTSSVRDGSTSRLEPGTAPNQQTNSSSVGTAMRQEPSNFPVREPITDAERGLPEDRCCSFSLKKDSIIDALMCLSYFPVKKPTTVAEVVALNDWCCGLSLETGAMIAGVLFLVWSLVQIAVSSLILFMLGTYYRLYKAESVTDIVTTAYFIYYIIEAICNIILLHGIVKARTVLFLPWLIIKTLGDIAVIVIAVISWSAVFWYERPSVGISIFFMCIIYLLPNVYFLRVVYSYYWMLEKNPESDRLVPKNENI